MGSAAFHSWIDKGIWKRRLEIIGPLEESYFIQPITLAPTIQLTLNAKVLQQITESKWMDLLGVALVIGVSISLGFHLTVREGIPIGYFSTFGAAGSMMVTRLVTKRNNIGNLIGLLTAVNSAFVDYYLGN